jgi:flagellar basal body-associated protein FliL
MADAAPAKAPTDASTTEASAAKPWWKSLLRGRWLAILIVGSLAIHSIVFILVRKSSTKSATPQGEFTVGAFILTAIDHPESSSEHREAIEKFNLHVRFIDDLDTLARQRSVAHQFRVRESLEGLMRKSKDVELDEAGMARLKHQIQQRIDEAIDLHAVAEVIITDLTITPTTAIAGSAEPSARPAPTTALAPATLPLVPPVPTENAAAQQSAHPTEPTSQSIHDVELGS